MELFFKNPEQASKDLAFRLKNLRLIKKWKRSTLADRSGVNESSLRRFEQTGKISMDNFLKLIHAFGRLDEVEALLTPPKAQSIAQLKRNETKISKRGTI